jgi:hypothetical protein
MNVPGECDAFAAAAELSFPLGEVVMRTLTLGRNAWRTSQQRARSFSYAAGAALAPPGVNCGCQKKPRFGSFQMTTSLMVGYRERRSRTYAQ